MKTLTIFFNLLCSIAVFGQELANPISLSLTNNAKVGKGFEIPDTLLAKGKSFFTDLAGNGVGVVVVDNAGMISFSSSSRLINVNTTQAGNPADTQENVLASYTIPGNTLRNDGDIITLIASWTGDNTNTPLWFINLNSSATSCGYSAIQSIKGESLSFRILRVSASLVHLGWTHSITKNLESHSGFQAVSINTANDITLDFIVTGTGNANEIIFKNWIITKN